MSKKPVVRAAVVEMSKPYPGARVLIGYRDNRHPVTLENGVTVMVETSQKKIEGMPAIVLTVDYDGQGSFKTLREKDGRVEKFLAHAWGTFVREV